jgi:hypothetical protein
LFLALALAFPFPFSFSFSFQPTLPHPAFAAQSGRVKHSPPQGEVLVVVHMNHRCTLCCPLIFSPSSFLLQSSSAEFFHDDGKTEHLLRLTGTLRVEYDDALYWIPLTMWLPRAFPSDPPFTFITPTVFFRRHFSSSRHVSYRPPVNAGDDGDQGFSAGGGRWSRSRGAVFPLAQDT